MKDHPLFPYYLEKGLAIHPNMSFFLMTPYFVNIGGWEGNLMAHHQLWTPHFRSHIFSLNHDKSTFLRRMVSSTLSDVVIASGHSKKTCLNKLMNMMMTMIIFSNFNKPGSSFVVLFWYRQGNHNHYTRLILPGSTMDWCWRPLPSFKRK